MYIIEPKGSEISMVKFDKGKFLKDLWELHCKKTGETCPMPSGVK